MSCDPCPANPVLQTVSCNLCPAIRVLRSMSCDPRPAIYVLQSLSCKMNYTVIRSIFMPVFLKSNQAYIEGNKIILVNINPISCSLIPPSVSRNLPSKSVNYIHPCSPLKLLLACTQLLLDLSVLSFLMSRLSTAAWCPACPLLQNCPTYPLLHELLSKVVICRCCFCGLLASATLADRWLQPFLQTVIRRRYRGLLFAT